jgi:hypothetical protein
MPFGVCAQCGIPHGSNPCPRAGDAPRLNTNLGADIDGAPKEAKPKAPATDVLTQMNKHHAATHPAPENKKVVRNKIGDVDVESGQVIILDPCYAGSVDYEAACEASQRKIDHTKRSLDDWKKIGSGTVSHTGVGDGLFPVYEIIEDGVLVGLEIRFDE